MSHIGETIPNAVDSIILYSNGLTIPNQKELVSCSGITSVNLPDSPRPGQRHYIKDSTGSALAAPITISGNGRNINNSSTSLIIANYGSVTVIYDEAFDVWSAV